MGERLSGGKHYCADGEKPYKQAVIPLSVRLRATITKYEGMGRPEIYGNMIAQCERRLGELDG